MKLTASVAYKAVASTSAEETMAAWSEGRDFRRLELVPGWIGGPYFSQRDASSLREIGLEGLQVLTTDGVIEIDF